MSVDLVDRMYFEVVDYDSAERLARWLGRARSTELLPEEPCLIVAAFRSEPADLAALLREVESWVEQESLCAIRFLLDDRIYVLEAGEADWAAHPWRARVEADESAQAV